MKPYLLIRNSGLAPIESFTILGLSTARGEVDKIGQFGSGSKHGILALIRAGITPRIFIGLDELVFSTHPAKMLEKDYLEVRYTFQGEQHKTGMCLDFGSLDWDKPAMALREFICNALDQGESIEACTALVDKAEPCENSTRVFVPTENETVQDYIEKMRSYFLHFSGHQDATILPARSENAQFYRRGVYVTQRLGNKEPAIFLYNFHDEKIDESRNMDGAAMSRIAAKLLRKSQAHLEIVLRTFGKENRWEHAIGAGLWDWMNDEGKKELAAAWKNVYGERMFATSTLVADGLTKKGIPYAPAPQSWKYALEKAGITDGETMLTKLDTARADECEATESAVETFQRAWRWIEAARLTTGKEFPAVKCFSQPMKDGGEKVGFYRDGTVYLNLEYDTNEQAALEELAHYITEADDETRDFQDFAFKLATRVAKLRSIPTS